MGTKFFATLKQVLQALSVNNKLVIQNKELVSVSDHKILTPVGDISPFLFNHISQLKDQFVSLEQLQKFINELTNNNAVIRLNHIGFCYKVSSREQEKERLTKLVKESEMHLYLEPSNDEGTWFFIGNADNWEDSMIELIPIEKTEDKWADYWLPHVQIDIDTTLTEEEIRSYVRSSFGDTVVPFSIKIDGVVYIVRNRLGTTDGVNITIDLATNSRNVKYQRLNLLKRVDNQ
jgi:hypothetical protein